MITKPWSPPPAAPAAVGAEVEGLNTADRYTFIDNHGTPHDLPMFGTLYAVLCSLRESMPCSVLLRGRELVSYDGVGQAAIAEFFAEALVNYEVHLLHEQHIGYDRALQWFQALIAEDKARAAAGRQVEPTAGHTPAISEQPATHPRSQADERRHPTRRQGGDGATQRRR